MKQLHRHNVLPFQCNASHIPASIHHHQWYLCSMLSCRASCQQLLKRKPKGCAFGRQSKTNFYKVYYKYINPLRGKSLRSSSKILLHQGLSLETEEVNEVIICHSRFCFSETEPTLAVTLLHSSFPLSFCSLFYLQSHSLIVKAFFPPHLPSLPAFFLQKQIIKIH